MAVVEARKPPPQFVAKLRRALGGRAGWGGFALQIFFVAVLAWIGYEIVANARANLQAQRITSGFGFLANTAGFVVRQNPISYFWSGPSSPGVFFGVGKNLVGAGVGVFFFPILCF